MAERVEEFEKQFVYWVVLGSTLNDGSERRWNGKHSQKAVDWLRTTLTQYHQDMMSEVVERLEGMRKPEVVTRDCENCGEEGWGKAWYGRGEATGDAWGDRYRPTGSVIFCKDCMPEFRIGKEWNGEEIWKVTSDNPIHDQIRINCITVPANKESNQALTEAQTIIKQLLESKN